MAAQILATKLYVPPPRPKVVLRPRLVDRLNVGLPGKLTLMSAAAGFGKTTLVSDQITGCGLPAAWLSLDEGDSDIRRFLMYLVAALHRVSNNIGADVLAALQSPQPPQSEPILTALLNEIANIPDGLILFIDDYHVVDAKPVDEALAFLLEHMPLQMHLVIATREDPFVPLARLRAREQLTELRAADLRFTPGEAAEFLNQVMGLNRSAEEIAALESRTEPHGSLVLKIGIHRGAAIAVTLNNRIDYYGQTVNIASRVQGSAGGDEVYLTEEIYSSLGVPDLLQEHGCKTECMVLEPKGVAGQVKICMVTGSN